MQQRLGRARPRAPRHRARHSDGRASRSPTPPRGARHRSRRHSAPAGSAAPRSASARHRRPLPQRRFSGALTPATTLASKPAPAISEKQRGRRRRCASPGLHQQGTAGRHGLRECGRREIEAQLVRQHIGGAERHDAERRRRAVAASGEPVHHLVDRAVAAGHRDHGIARGIAGLGEPARIAGRGGLDDIDRPARARTWRTTASTSPRRRRPAVGLRISSIGLGARRMSSNCHNRFTATQRLPYTIRCVSVQSRTTDFVSVEFLST